LIYKTQKQTEYYKTAATNKNSNHTEIKDMTEQVINV